MKNMEILYERPLEQKLHTSLTSNIYPYSPLSCFGAYKDNGLVGNAVREIKFRAWDSGRKKWRLGVALDENGDQYTWQEIKRDEYAYRKLSSNFLTLSFYTGLKDKNGKEIYGGDIVEREMGYYKDPDGGYGEDNLVRYQEKCEVTFNNGRFKLITETVQDFIDPRLVEVIGNIYENPELLND